MGFGLLQIVLEPDIGRYASEEAEPQRGGHRRVLVRTLAPNGVDWGVPHRLEKGTSASEDAGSREEWIVRSHIGWGGERSLSIRKWNLLLGDIF